jgi:hypothetical protein
MGVPLAGRYAAGDLDYGHGSIDMTTPASCLSHTAIRRDESIEHITQ